MRLPDLAHLLYHCGRSRRGTVTRLDPTLPYTHPNIPQLSLLNFNSLHPALFTLRTRLPSGVPEELIGSYYHDDARGA